VHGVLPQLSSALPSDKLEAVLDRYQSFALTQCQCRQATRAVGAGCDRPLDNCMALGDWAESAIDQGLMRRIERRDAIALKREAESAGCVTWVLNMATAAGQASCSCCGCCCHPMRWMREFDAPALFAPPHFHPRVDDASCNHCGACARHCPMGAMAVEPGQHRRWWLPERCLGCGQCVLACKKKKAIEMVPVPDYRLPPDSWLAFALRAAPGVARTAWDRWRERRLDTTWWVR
jgi:Pyruvate/2-oxoacid:ferredoxin oxidoreductase delta subunit